MKDEIKEILDKLSKEENYIQHSYCRLFNYEANTLLDYITNLQTIEQQYSAILSENAELENKITNLQEENKRLKELCDKYEEEHSTTFEYWKRLVKEDYKSRNEKAIEFLEHFDSGQQCEHTKDLAIIVENILQGEDKDE